MSGPLRDFALLVLEDLVGPASERTSKAIRQRLKRQLGASPKRVNQALTVLRREGLAVKAGRQVREPGIDGVPWSPTVLGLKLQGDLLAERRAAGLC